MNDHRPALWIAEHFIGLWSGDPKDEMVGNERFGNRRGVRGLVLVFPALRQCRPALQ
jgi:hypothetical protein